MTDTSTSAPASFLGSSGWALAANALTVARVILAPILVLLLLQQNPWWATFWVGVAAALTDFFDGRFARRSTPTTLGAFLDPLADKAIVIVGGFALVAIGRFWWLPVALITVREVGMTVYRSWLAGRDISVPARTSAKYKTLVQGLALLAAVFPPFEGVPWVADTLLWFAVVFTFFTAAQYAIDGRGLLAP